MIYTIRYRRHCRREVAVMGTTGKRASGLLWAALLTMLAVLLSLGIAPKRVLAESPDDDQPVDEAAYTDCDLTAQADSDEVTITYWVKFPFDIEDGAYYDRMIVADSGETVTIPKVVLDFHVFDGWYENGELLSTENPWTFLAERDMNIQARYKRLISLTDMEVQFGGVGEYGEGEGWAYTGEPITPRVSLYHEYVGGFKEGVDFTVTYENNVNPGRAYAIVNGIGDCTGTKRQSFEIWGNLSQATIDPIANQIYTGSGAVTPAPKVTFAGKTLTADKDYTVSYKNNDRLGTATVTVKGKGGAYYNGSKSATFKIVDTKPTWSGASRLPVGASANVKVTNGGWIRLKSGGKWVTSNSVLSLTAPSATTKRITAKAPGTTTLYLLDSSGKQVASKKVTVYAITGDKWEIQSAVDKNYVLDIRGKSKANSARMIVYQRNNGSNQRFQFVKMSDNCYLIKCVHSGKYVDVQGGGTDEGKLVIQYARNSKDNQRWKIWVDANNRLTFVSKKSKLCFDIMNGKAVNGANMIQWPSNNGKNQKWVLNKK